MLVELFAWHPSVNCFEGNPLGAFCALIMGKEYRQNEMPDLIGLYRGWYTIMFFPGELLC